MFPAMALVGPRYKRSCRLEVYLEPRVALADQIVPPCHGCRAFTQTGITRAQPDRIELNEAFAARALAVMGDLKLDPSKVNPLGGAIALGHPLGPAGAVRIATLLHGMRRRKYGMVIMCIGHRHGRGGDFRGPLIAAVEAGNNNGAVFLRRHSVS
jgi:hypothetical protein